MAVFFFTAHEKGFKFHAQPQAGAYSCCILNSLVFSTPVSRRVIAVCLFLDTRCPRSMSFLGLNLSFCPFTVYQGSVTCAQTVSPLFNHHNFSLYSTVVSDQGSWVHSSYVFQQCGSVWQICCIVPHRLEKWWCAHQDQIFSHLSLGLQQLFNVRAPSLAKRSARSFPGMLMWEGIHVIGVLRVRHSALCHYITSDVMRWISGLGFRPRTCSL